MFSKVLPTLVLSLALASPALPQEAERSLTNADVAAMLKAGLPQSSIAYAIEISARRGTAQFDTSPQALIQLKNQGATAMVLNAMLAAQTFPKRVAPSATVPGLPTARGVYYQAGNRFLELQSVVLWPEVDMGWKGMTPVEDRKYVLTGPGAQTHVQSATPVFYVRDIGAQRTWQLVKLEVKKDTREWRTVKAEMFRVGPSIEQPQNRAPDLLYKAVSSDVFQLCTAAPLEPGQYALITSAPGQPWLVETYEFAV